MHGRFDLCILPKQIFQTALILECKHSKSVKELVSDAKEGAKQIIDNKYEDEIINDGYLHVKGYGISFYKKYCYITISVSKSVGMSFGIFQSFFLDFFSL